MVLFIIPAYRAPGVHTGPPWGCHGKNIKNLLLQNHKAQSFHILCVAMFSGPLYKSCQSCPWGQKWPRPGGSLAPIDLQWEKHKKNLLLQNHKAHGFLTCILFVAMYSEPKWQKRGYTIQTRALLLISRVSRSHDQDGHHTHIHVW